MSRSLRALAAAWGVQLSYTDVNGVRQSATPAGALGVLRALGAPVEDPDEIETALAERQAALAEQIVEPVVVSWIPEEPSFELRSPHAQEATLVLATGETHSWPVPAGRAGRRVPIPAQVPMGYHALHVGATQALLIRAPSRAVEWSERSWGVFMPAYAIRTQRDWGAGDLGSLTDLLVRIGERGGSVVATLPLLAVFLDEPFDPAPYSPVSKLFWNELMIDVDAIEDVGRSPEAAEALRSGRLREQIEALRASAMVDYKAVNELKRSVLMPLARASAGEPAVGVAGDVRADLEDYAAFRARTAAAGPWSEWSGALPAPDPDELLYHRYVQTVLSHQLTTLDKRATEADATLLFDLPVGVHPLGYDAWRYQSSFADGANVGAPPDSFFTKGQDWGFRPLHPEQVRATGYAYQRACLRRLLEHAHVLRIDHIIGLHRIWWIPPGHDAADGAFVRYRPEEMYAILALESHRAGALVVGEDLGTVPREVRRMMGAHGIARTYVVQEEIDPDAGLRPVPAASLATVNTHDMPTFATFWSGADIDQRLEMGLFDRAEAEAEREARRTKRDALRRTIGDGDPLRATLTHLGRSKARLVVANLEDLWGETDPVNIPGTKDGNWRRRGRQELSSDSPAWETLDALNASRRDG